MTLHIRGTTTGPIVLGPNSKQLTTITSTGAVISSGDGIDGPATNPWPIANDGTIAASGGLGISLAAGGNVSNGPGALISGGIAGILINGARGAVANAGTIHGLDTGSTVVNTTLVVSGDGIALVTGGSVTNAVSGSISGAGPRGSGDATGSGVFITGGSGKATNYGSVNGGAYGMALDAGGSVTNSGSIGGTEDGVKIDGAIGRVVNSGSVVATVDDGVALFAGGDVANAPGALIKSGPGFGPNPSAAGVFIATSGSGTVENGGSIDGAIFGVFAGTGSVTNAASGSIGGSTAGVIFNPLAPNSGPGTLVNAGQISASGGAGADLEDGGSVTNASGASMSGSAFGVFVGGAAGTVTNAGTLTGGAASVHFGGPGANVLVVRPGAVFNGPVTESNGTLTVTGSPDSATEVFQLDNGTLDVAAAIGANATINFINPSPSTLAIDNAASFGTDVGTNSYTGPLLEDFSADDIIDLKHIGTGVTLAPLTPSGLLQVSNGSRVVADLAFQTSSGASFQTTSDNNGGVLIMLATPST